MLIAISATDRGLGATVDPRFGRARMFALVDSDTPEEVRMLDNVGNSDQLSGAGISTAQAVVDAGAKVVISGRVGPKALDVLSAAGLEIYTGADGSVSDAISAWQAGRLTPVTEAMPGRGMGRGRGGGGGRGMGGGGRRG
ncbi:NifB/NifX family molybdenum-iron cluster-binding protein [bacterium]|nr:NifB/NifX family molybdenum-iron cluster-binding protein [bacterium]